MTITAPVWITTAGSIGSNIAEGSTYNYILQATDNTISQPNTQPFSYTLISGSLPPGLTLEALSGTVYGTIPEFLKTTSYTFTIRAANTHGISDRTFSITIQQNDTTWITAQNLPNVLQESYFSMRLLADDPGNTSLTYSLISGELPAGLELHSNGYINGYLAAISTPAVTYTFTILASGAIPETRTFTMTVVAAGPWAPQWNTISAYELGNGLEGGNLGNLTMNIPYSFQLLSVVPFSSDQTTYTLQSGNLPPGITLSSSGLLSGTLTSSVVQIWPITIQITDPITDLSVTAVFYFKTNYISASNLYWVVSTSTIPYDLTTIAINQTVEFSIGAQSYQITKTSQTSLSQDLINEIFTKTNLTLANSFIVVMNSAGNYTIYQNYNGVVYNVFTFVVLTETDYIFDLGMLYVGEPSILKVGGISLSPWIQYDIVSGSLPLGLFLNASNGMITGTVQEQASGTYTFKLRIRNYAYTEDLDYSIEIAEATSYKSDKLTVRLTQLAKLDWYTLRDINLISATDIYRMGDASFGQDISPEIVIVSEMAGVTREQVFALTSDLIQATLTPLNFIYTPVVDTDGNTICEAVLLKMQDDFRRSGLTGTNITGITVHPGGLEAIRQLFITAGYAPLIASNADTQFTSVENWQNYYFATSLLDNNFSITGTPPDFLIGDAIVFHGQTLPSPFENDVVYNVIPMGIKTFRLAASEADANNGKFISFNINADEDTSGTLQFFFPALLLAYVNIGAGSALAAKYNSEQNIVPFGYFTTSLVGSTVEFTDTFFGTIDGHNMNTGDPIKFWELPLDISYLSGTTNVPFAFDQIYYVIVDSATTFKLALTKADALLGNAVTINGYIDNRTGVGFAGSFKKLLTTQNNTVVLDEANTRFTAPVEILTIDSRYKLKQVSSATNVITLNKHHLETGQSVKFSEQLTLPTQLANDTIYYVIYRSENTFQLALTKLDALNDISITFDNFTGLLAVDTSTPVFINTISKFSFSATYTEVNGEMTTMFVSTQVAPLKTGDIIQLENIVVTLPISGPPGSSFVSDQPYSVIQLTDKTFLLANPSTPSVPITALGDFNGDIILGNNWSEYDLSRGG